MVIKGKDCWYKRTADEQEFYCLSPNYQVSYFSMNDRLGSYFTDGQVIKELLDIKKEYGILPHRDFTKYDNTNVYYADTKIKEEQCELPSGTYYFASGQFTDHPDRLVKQDFRMDQYLNIFNKAEEIKDQIRKFLGGEELDKELNCIHKFSLLLYGPQGEGKSSFIRHLVTTDEMFKDAIVISINEDLPAVSFMQALNKSTKGRLKVFILEEITNLASTSQDTRKLLTFLDGEHSIDNCIILSTTNHPELLPKNIVERPYRIDQLYKMSSPSREEARKLVEYYYKQLPTEDELEEITGKSTAFIQGICVNALRNQITLSESIAKVKAMFDIAKNDFNDKKLGL